MKVDIIVGARPNFIKVAGIISEIDKAKESGHNIDYRLIHTGQHYDNNMSGSFFDQLSIPKPTINFNAGGGTHSEQTAAIMINYEKVLSDDKPDLCLVVGDVNSTMACSIVAQKAQVKVAHVEAGIRSGDWSMPEEINRLVTDSITNYFFTTTPLARENLRNNGVANEKIFLVGNTMIDTLLRFKQHFLKPSLWDKFNLKKKGYLVLTLHRPGNVDQEGKLKAYLEEILNNSSNLSVIFPVHPRTASILEKLDFFTDKLILTSPLTYLEFNYLVDNSLAVITDSGGITEETTVLKIPCLTLRDNTERPETVEIGTNELIGTNPVKISPALKKLMDGNWKIGSIPDLWDGNTSERIVKILLTL